MQVYVLSMRAPGPDGTCGVLRVCASQETARALVPLVKEWKGGGYFSTPLSGTDGYSTYDVTCCDLEGFIDLDLDRWVGYQASLRRWRETESIEQCAPRG